MNRPIKFRGKRVDTNEWIFGWLAPSLGNDTMCIMPESYFATMDFGESEDDDKPILQEGMALGEFFIVDASTVGQFTGLLDKDGKEIYETDIVQHTAWNYPFEIIFHNDKARFVCRMATTLTHHIDCENLSVVGNTHDNPELLK